MCSAMSTPPDRQVRVSGIHITWNTPEGTCAFQELPVAMMWIDSTLAGLMAGVQAMVGTPRFALALQAEGRKSVEADWLVISQFTDFHDGFAAIANIASVAGWGQWELTALDIERKECRFRVRNSWEGCYQKALGVCWGSAMLAGKLAGYCSKLFKTNCWADQTSFIAKSSAFDEFLVKPSDRSIEREIDNLLATDEATRADMAVALQKLEMDLIERKRMEEDLRKSRDELEQRVAERTAELAQRAAQLTRLTSELTLAEYRERRRLARLLHDHLQQLLVGAKFGLEVLLRRVDASSRLAVEQAQELLDESIKASRVLTAELSPPILHEAGLAAGLEWLVRWMLEKYGLNVELTADTDIHMEQEDVRVLLFQSVRELLLNVAKHAGVNKARVELSRLDNDHVSVIVSDEGVGFHKDQLSQPSDDVLMQGFGLFNIRERLQIFGGSMDIDTGPRKGTRVTLVVPCPVCVAREGAAKPAGPTMATEAAPGQPAEAGKTRILLVDDHIVMREGLSQLLEAQEDLVVVGQASDGQEAVEAARTLRPDVILMDSSMPRMDGAEATRIIHAEQPGVRIVGLSMYEEADRATAMLVAGASDYITKSGSPELLLSAVRRHED